MDPTEAIALLQVLWPCDGWGEIRALKGQQMLKPLFLKLPLMPKNLNPALEWCHKENEKGANIYFGVHCRNNPRGRNEDVSHYTTLIADIDNAEYSWPLIKQLQDAGCPASICVRTPRGLHLYWLLKEPELTTGQARMRMQKLQRALHSDNVHDPARILRLPGARCHKAEGKLIYIVWLNPEVKYSSEEIDQYVSKLWPDIVVQEQTKLGEIKQLQLTSQPMAEEVWASYAAPAVKGTRSQRCLSFIQHALMLGWKDTDIMTALENIPIGGHYLDRPSPHGAFLYDFNKAQQNMWQAFSLSTRVIINSISIYENAPVDDAAPGIKKLKVHFIEKTRASYGASFVDWITIPDQWRTDRARWLAFLSAVGIRDGLPIETIVSQLFGKSLRVNFRDDAVNKVRYYLPDVENLTP